MIRIVHTRAEGTLLEGSRKGDGVYEIVRTRENGGFRWSRHVGIYLPHSQDKAAKMWEIDRAAAALRAAGFEVEVDVDNVTAGRSFADAEADRNERAEGRADRYAERASRNTSAGNARWDRTRERMSGIPLGQPILVGHHSERRHRRQIEWAHNQDRKALDEVKKGKYWAGRTQAAENYQRHREDPGTTRRRIDKLEADKRRLERRLADGWTQKFGPDAEIPTDATLLQDYGQGYGLYRLTPSEEWTATQNADIAQLDDELGYWRQVLAEAEQRGVKLWTKADFTKGDFVIYMGAAIEVMRANTKSLTVPWGHYWAGSGLLIVTVEFAQKVHKSGGRIYTDTLPYDKVQGRLSAEEAAAAIRLPVAEAKRLITSRVREARGEAAPDQPGAQS
ncbi:DUF3560 domain-containing protein [Microtetraspora malaysiensis]|uniref:DUF3560 domain-containing protein n=1 Tax=Microtetraspora malaysiensis TaxID=161358 RepID=A0ABW6SKE1_9ACTN